MLFIVRSLFLAFFISCSALAATAPPSTVIYRGQSIITLHERLGAFTPAERVAAIDHRLQEIASDRLLSLESLTLKENESSTDLLAGDRILLTITDEDAKAEMTSRQELSAQALRMIHDTLLAERNEKSMRQLVINVIYAALVTLGMVLIFMGFGRIFPATLSILHSWNGTRIRSIRLKNLEVLTADRITRMAAWAVQSCRVLLTLLLLYFYLPLVFSFFPWTANLAPRLYGYVLTPLQTIGSLIAAYIPNLFFIGVICLVTGYILKFAHFIFDEIEVGTIQFTGFHKEWAQPTYKLARLLICAFALVVIFPYLPGSGSPAFQGVSVFLGILFSLGSSSAIANIVAGVVLTYMRPFKIGDRVKIADTMGDVIEKSLLVTRIRTTKNVDVTIPNSMVLGSHIINYSSSITETGLILHTTITIGYDVPWRKVHELLVQAASRTEAIASHPKPYILQTALNDFHVSYELNAFTQIPNQMARIYSELHQHVQDVFNEASVEILSPHYSAVRDGHQMAIPEEYLPRAYQAPGFRFLPGVSLGAPPVDPRPFPSPSAQE